MELRNSFSLAGLVVVGVLLSGCSASAGASIMTLAQTKSPTQLLRNDAISRLQAQNVDKVSEQQDFSASCKSKSDDPDGLFRSWRSTILASVPKDAAVGVDQVVGALATSFAEDDWTMEPIESESGDQVFELRKEATPVTITLTATGDGDGDGYGASIYIEAAGQCVKTGGPQSAEVEKLEG